MPNRGVDMTMLTGALLTAVSVDRSSVSLSQPSAAGQ